MPDKEKPYKIDITAALIKQYLEGRLDGKTMHAIERQALEDPFLAEALEGFERRHPNQSDNIRDLKARLETKVKQRKDDRKKGWIIRYRNLQVAAAAVLLLVIGISIFFLAPETDTKTNKISYRQNDQVIIPEALPADTSSSLSVTISKTKDTNATPDLAVHQQEKHTLPDVKKRKEIKLSEQNDENSDTAVVVAYATQKKEALTGSVHVVPAPALMAARTSGNNQGISVSKRYEEDNILISGKVKDSGTGKPLQGVTVRVAGTERGTVSDASGNFKLTLPAQSDTLNFAYIGYITKSIVPGDGGQHLNVNLQPSSTGLNEMVVVGYGKSAKSSNYSKNKARPLGGFTSFRRYIKGNLNYPTEALAHHVEGIVKLSFLVYPDTTIHDITVIQSLGYGCDEEAIRLLSKGPAWYPVVRGDTTLQKINVHFRLKGKGKK